MARFKEQTRQPGKRGPKGPSKPMSDEQFEMISGLVLAYCTKKEISSFMRMSEDTLERRLQERGVNFAAFFAQKRAAAGAKVRKVMLEKALSGDTSMLIWWSKNYLGMSDKQQVDHSSVYGSLTTQVMIYRLPDNGRD